jgi:inward rectifier potassium channel
VRSRHNSAGPIVTTDAPRYDWRDPYHVMLAMGWGPFLLGVLGYFLVLNAVFGTLYAMWPGSVANLPPGRWDDAFFFSVETFGSVGYSVMAPQTSYGHFVATVEVFLGLLSTAMLTGLIFVRFARPRANIEFSRQITIAPHDGVPTLSLRLAHRRTGTIFHAEACLTYVRRYQTLEGHEMWRGRRQSAVGTIERATHRDGCAVRGRSPEQTRPWPRRCTRCTLMNRLTCCWDFGLST